MRKANRSILAKGGAAFTALALVVAMAPGMALAETDGVSATESSSDTNSAQPHGSGVDATTANDNNANITTNTAYATVGSTNGDTSDPSDGFVGPDYVISIPATVSLSAKDTDKAGEIGTYQGYEKISYRGTIGIGEVLTVAPQTNAKMKDVLGWSTSQYDLTVDAQTTDPESTTTTIPDLTAGVKAESDGTIKGYGYFKLESDIESIGEWQGKLVYDVSIGPIPIVTVTLDSTDYTIY